jgi:hypothetical protein
MSNNLAARDLSDAVTRNLVKGQGWGGERRYCILQPGGTSETPVIKWANTVNCCIAYGKELPTEAELTALLRDDVYVRMHGVQFIPVKAP